MLFLLNDRVIDIGEPETTLVDLIGIAGLRHERLTAADVVEIGQEIYLRAGRGREPDLTTQMVLASLLALKLNIDAAMFNVGPMARRPSDVETRFASQSSPLVARLYAQGGKDLAPRAVSEAVWNSAR